MDVNASGAESQISTLLLGTATNILNHVANQQMEIKILSEAIQKEREKTKTLESEIQKLESALEATEIEIAELSHKKNT